VGIVTALRHHWPLISALVFVAGVCVSVVLVVTSTPPTIGPVRLPPDPSTTSTPPSRPPAWLMGGTGPAPLLLLLQGKEHR
jgi:hypothetical protein